MEELVQKVDIMLDASSVGIGAKNKELYAKYGKKAIFQGGDNRKGLSSTIFRISFTWGGE